MSQSISIALCTFNGEPYLAEQLQSLKDQSRLPDEVVACDDGSSDRTIEILEEFAKSSQFPVRILQNETNLGPAQNFGKAIAACTGDIISLCDQDDVWEANKIELTRTVFNRDPDPAHVFSDAEVCDLNCHRLGYRLWTSVGFVGRLRKQFDAGHGLEVLLRQNVVTGATLSFASRFRPLILPIAPGWMHDGWIALLLSAIGKGKAIAEPLIRYRQHPSQSIGATKRSFYQQYLNAKKMSRTVFSEQGDEYQAAMHRLQQQAPVAVIQQLQEKINHCRRRSAIRQRQTNRVSTALVELAALRYRRFSLGWKSFAQDIFL